MRAHVSTSRPNAARVLERGRELHAALDRDEPLARFEANDAATGAGKPNRAA
jgi:hypothetical protein